MSIKGERAWAESTVLPETQALCIPNKSLGRYTTLLWKPSNRWQDLSCLCLRYTARTGVRLPCEVRGQCHVVRQHLGPTGEHFIFIDEIFYFTFRNLKKKVSSYLLTLLPTSFEVILLFGETINDLSSFVCISAYVYEVVRTYVSVVCCLEQYVQRQNLVSTLTSKIWSS